MVVYIHGEMVIDMVDIKSEQQRSKVVDIKSETQFDELLEKNELVFADFWASWCGPCMILKPIIEKVCKDKGVVLAKVNVDDNRSLAQRYQVSSIPVIILFKWGEMRTGALGNKSAADIIKMIDDERSPPKEALKTE